MMDVTKSDILKLFTRTVYVHSWHKVQIQKMLMHPSLAAAISFGNMLFGRGEANSVGTPCVVTSKYFVALFENLVAQPVPHAQSRDIRIPPSHCLLDLNTPAPASTDAVSSEEEESLSCAGKTEKRRCSWIRTLPS